MESRRPILFLYLEMAEYFLACIEEASKLDIEIHIVHWKVNKEAPFQFRSLDQVTFYDRDELGDNGLINLADRINPTAIFCAGWVDKGYTNLCKNWKKKVPTVLLLDNQWSGSLKQQLARLAAPFVIRNKFSHAWVPGDPQQAFASKLGFHASNIQKGYYCADTKLFIEFNEQQAEAKAQAYPHTALFLGRYLEFKGIFDLWSAFIETNSDWKLICAGTGELWEQRVQHDSIEHVGFVQPADLGDIIARCGLFILPSHFEPWGVVIHEMAAAGLPIISSRQVGAATMFVEEGKNGWLFEGGDKQSLSSVMTQAFGKTDEQLIRMGKHSANLAATLTPASWSKTLLEFL